jgi:nucleoside phosphorylase
MESVAVYKACQTMNIPVIGIRIISNNEITGNDDVDKQFEFAQLALQEFIYDFIENLTKNWF